MWQTYVAVFVSGGVHLGKQDPTGTWSDLRQVFPLKIKLPPLPQKCVPVKQKSIYRPSILSLGVGQRPAFCHVTIKERKHLKLFLPHTPLKQATPTSPAQLPPLSKPTYPLVQRAMQRTVKPVSLVMWNMLNAVKIQVNVSLIHLPFRNVTPHFHRMCSPCWPVADVAANVLVLLSYTYLHFNSINYIFYFFRLNGNVCV